MTTTVKCTFLEPTLLFERKLRRYEAGTSMTCTGPMGYHDKSIPLDVKEFSEPPKDESFPLDDPRWPFKCDCGYEFKDSDCWQLFTSRLYIDNESGQLCPLKEAPMGAMWWLEDPEFKGPDKKGLMIKTALGDWCPDAPRLDGKPYFRLGKPPLVSIHPEFHYRDRRTEKTIHGKVRNGDMTYQVK